MWKDEQDIEKEPERLGREKEEEEEEGEWKDEQHRNWIRSLCHHILS